MTRRLERRWDRLDRPLRSGDGILFLKNAGTGGPADAAFSFGGGGVGYKPVAGDWNGDTLDSVGLYDPATAVFLLKNSNTNGTADIVFGYGPPGAPHLFPVTGTATTRTPSAVTWA